MRSESVRTREATKAIVGNVVKGDSALVEMAMLVLVPNHERVHMHTGGEGAQRHLRRIPQDPLQKDTQMLTEDDQTIDVKLAGHRVVADRLNQGVNLGSQLPVGFTGVAGKKIRQLLRCIFHRRLLDGRIRDHVRELLVRRKVGLDVLQAGL